MLRYLSPDEEYNQLFNKFPDRDALEDWVRIFTKADSEESRNKLLGVALRFLESYPNNMGLLLVSTGLRLSLPNENPNLARDDFDLALSILDNNRSNEEAEKVLKTLLEYLFNTEQYYPSTVSDIVKQCSEFIDKTEFDIWLYQQKTTDVIKKYTAAKLVNVISGNTEKLLEKLKA